MSDKGTDGPSAEKPTATTPVEPGSIKSNVTEVRFGRRRGGIRNDHRGRCGDDQLPVPVFLSAPDLAARFIGQKELAWRWNMSTRTLERWRSVGKGIPYVKVGGHVLYRLTDVERHETANVRHLRPRIPPPKELRLPPVEEPHDVPPTRGGPR